MKRAKVAVLYTSPETVIEDYRRLMKMVDYTRHLPKDNQILLKLNLSWTKFYPACSSPPWQLDGVLTRMLADGYSRRRLIPVENRTVVTDPWKGAANNKWLGVLAKHRLRFTALTEVEWVKHEFRTPLPYLSELFPAGIYIPKMFVGRSVLHLPTVKTHGHATTTGAVKNSFGGLLREVRHYAHEFIHQVLAELMIMQKELHPSIFAVMDGTVAGDGAGPRTMRPVVKNVILASADSVALDAVAAKMMGFDPMSIGYIRMCTERGLGMGDIKQIEVVGENVKKANWGFHVRRSFVIWGDQMIRKGPLRPFKRLLLHSRLVPWAWIASGFYHDHLWLPLVGSRFIREFEATEWGRLFASYPYVAPPVREPRPGRVAFGYLE